MIKHNRWSGQAALRQMLINFWSSQLARLVRQALDCALLTAQAGQHEGDDGEEPGEGHGHHGQGGRPGELAEWGAVCRGREQ